MNVLMKNYNDQKRVENFNDQLHKLKLLEHDKHIGTSLNQISYKIRIKDRKN